MAYKIMPESNIKLLSNTKLSNDYQNTLYFNGATEQASFFLSRVFRDIQQSQYVRKGQTIRVNEVYDKLYDCDYVMYKNTNFGDKWFYAFITRKNYVNDRVTEIDIEIDCFQTWMFDIQYFPTFISRAHQREFLNNKPIFDNLYPEQLEYGRDYVVTHTEVFSRDSFYAVICSSADLRGSFGDVNEPNLPASIGGVFDGLPSALDYYVVDSLTEYTGRTSTLYEILSELSKYPWITQCIQSITVVPREVIGDNWGVDTVHGFTIGYLRNNYVSSNSATINFENYLDYFPKYNHSKLYAFPYSYIEMTCFNGTQFLIKPEAVGNGSLQLKVINYVGAQPRLSYFVDGYNDNGDNGTELPDGQTYYGEFLDASVSNGNFPQLPVTIDNYLLYMANNANSFQLTNSIARYNQVEGAAVGIGQALLGSPGRGLGTAYNAIKQGEITVRQQAAKIQDAELNPPSLAGQTGGDAFNIANGINGVTLKWKTIRPQYAERLERYFERYGYVQNKIEIPMLYGMSSFNYIQTTNILIGGNIPDEDRNTIKNMFDNGVTLWHNNQIGDYTSNIWVGA